MYKISDLTFVLDELRFKLNKESRHRTLPNLQIRYTIWIPASRPDANPP